MLVLEYDNKILVYDLEGEYCKTIQLPYSSTGQDNIIVVDGKLYIECATGRKYEYDEKRLEVCAYGDEEILNYLLEQGANVTEVDKNGATTLIAAAQTGNIDNMRFLISFWKKG